MSNAIGTNEIFVSFGSEILAAGLGGVQVSWSSNGEFVYGPTVTAEEKAGVEAVFAAHNPVKAELTAYNAFVRWASEIGGIEVDTDRASQQLMASASAAGQARKWKNPDGTFVELTAQQINTMMQETQNHIDGCFRIEAATQDGIDNGTITEKSQIEAAYSGMKSKNFSRPKYGYQAV